ncbi:MAG: hypothetical protein DMF92_17090 [Acidobacteria bacterium]|nr:MAG: hypothetical protein DMF92_17090 [Acidobacteriota bacterium]
MPIESRNVLGRFASRSSSVWYRIWLDCGPRVGDSLNHSSRDRSSVLRFQPNLLSEIHERAVSTYCVARRVDPFSKSVSFPISAAGVHGRIREAVTTVCPSRSPHRPWSGTCDTRGEQDDVLQVPPGDRNLAHLRARSIGFALSTSSERAATSR